MGRVIDITGQRFGRLVALSLSPLSMKRWKFQCDCGAVADIKKYSVTSGAQISCGCHVRHAVKALGAMRSIDISGQKFGMLTALNLAPMDERNRGDKGSRWLCKCDCGEMRTIRGTLLRYGQTKSCGCLRGKGKAEPRPISAGEKMGLLTALYDIGACGDGQGKSWICGCECGEAHIARAKDLRIGTTRSCGCARVASQKRNAEANIGKRLTEKRASQ